MRRNALQLDVYQRVLCGGRVAQLGEHLLCKQGVAGSNPVTSTNLFNYLHGSELDHLLSQQGVNITVCFESPGTKACSSAGGLRSLG